MAFVNTSLFPAFGPLPYIAKGRNDAALHPSLTVVTLEESSFLFCFLPIFGIFCLLYIISNYILFFGQPSVFEKKFVGAKRVLFVTAHPDDECMFFGPLITHLSGTATDVYLVCLSNGNYEGLGIVRTKELWMSCRKLGICDENIRLYKHELLPDNPKVSWNPLIIGHIIMQYVETLCIDTLITFDAYGVSGHPNHSAIYRAVMHLTGKRAVPNYCKVYVLESVNILRKYSVCTDLLISYFTSKYLYICCPEKRKMILDAMAQHSSQLLWYRHLYLMFSRYVYMNTVKSIS